ncbi:MAG: MarR family transcriptional regulator [Terricaulis sp.]
MKQRLPLTDFADELGVGYMNLVIRRIGQLIASAGDAYMRERGIAVPATSTSVLTYVSLREGSPLAEIAQSLGYTHQAVAKVIDMFEAKGLVQVKISDEDMRMRLVTLTRKGRREADLVRAVADRAAIVFEEVFDEIGVDVFSALRDFERALARRPLSGRLLDAGTTDGGLARRSKRPRTKPQ